MKNGTNLILYPIHGRDNQLWCYDGTYIRCKKNPNFVVDVANVEIKNGANLQLWECNGSDAQKWDFDGTVFKLRKNPDYVIDLDSNKAEARRNIHLWKSNNTTAQRWHHGLPFVPKDLPCYFPIRLKSNPNWVVDIEGGKMSNGTKLILWKYHGGSNQLWLYDGTYIRSKADPQYVIDVRHSQFRNGTTIHLWKQNGTFAQRWNFDGEVFRLRENNSLVLDLHSNKVQPRQPVHLWTYNASDAQKWIHKEEPKLKASPLLEELFNNLPNTDEYKSYKQIFMREEIDLEILQEMDHEILRECWVAKLLHRKKIMNAIRKLLAKGEDLPPDYVTVNEYGTNEAV